MIAANLLRTELSDQEIDELADFLQGRCLPKGGMNISMLDGYLTAIVSMPEFVPPSHWLPRVWSRVYYDGANQELAPDNGFVFASAQEEQRMTGFILRRMTEIIGDFERARLQPIFLKRRAEEGVAQPVFADVWCVGYLRGMAVHEDAWEPLVSRRHDDRASLAPIFALALSILTFDSDDDKTDDDNTPKALMSDEKRAEFTERIPSTACAIHRYWRERQRTPQGTIHRTPLMERSSVRAWIGIDTWSG